MNLECSDATLDTTSGFLKKNAISALFREEYMHHRYQEHIRFKKCIFT